MLSWIKNVLDLLKPKENHFPNDCSLHQQNGEEKGAKGEDEGLNILLEQEESGRKNNANSSNCLSLSTPPPSPPTTQSLPNRHTPTAILADQQAHSSIWYSETPTKDLPNVFPETQFSSGSRWPSASPNKQTKYSTRTPPILRTFDTQDVLGTSQYGQSLISDIKTLQGSQHGKLAAANSPKIDKIRQQAACGEVLAPKMHQNSEPCCFLAATLTNHTGDLVTVKGKRYVRVRVKEKLLMVSLEIGPDGESPCRVVWQSGRPVPLVELPDLTCVKIDAFVAPKSKRLHTVLVWQNNKPDRCVQLLDNSYIFLDGRGLVCHRKSLDIIAKELSIVFDGTPVSAEICDAVVFIDSIKATMLELLQLGLEEFYATVFKMLEGTGSGRVLYVCTCLWVGKRPSTKVLPMAVEKQKLYTKLSHGLYSASKTARTLYCDVDANLSLSAGTGTLEVELEGSSRCLVATHLLTLQHSNLKEHGAARVSVHVNKQVCGKKEDWSAVMIKLPSSTGIETTSTWLAAKNLSPHAIRSGVKEQNVTALQETSVSSAQKASVSSVQRVSIPPAQGTNVTSVQKSNVPVEQKDATLTKQKGADPVLQTNSALVSHKAYDPVGQMANVPAAQNDYVPGGKNASVPAAQKASVLVGVRASVPIGQKASIPAARKSSVLTGEKAITPARQTSSTLAAQNAKVLGGKKDNVPAAQRTSAPTGENDSVPAGQKKKVASRQKTSVPATQKASVPAEEKAGVSAAQKSSVPPGQQTDVSGAQKGSSPAGQEASVPAAQWDNVLTGRKDAVSGEQKAAVPLAQKLSVPAAEKSGISPLQKTNVLAAQVVSNPAGKANALFTQKTTVPTRKEQRKSASLSQLSCPTSAGLEDTSGQASEYLTCKVLTAGKSSAVVGTAGKKILVVRNDIFVDGVQLSTSANVASSLKKFPNIGVIFTYLKQQHQVLGHTVERVALVAWGGKKPLTANTIVNQRLSKVNAAAAASKVTPAPSAASLAAAVTVQAGCWIKEVHRKKKRVTLTIRSKHLPEGCETAQANLENMYMNGTPVTQTQVKKLKDKTWHCLLCIEDGGQQLTVPLAWLGKKSPTDTSSRNPGSQSRQSLSTGNLSDVKTLSLMPSASKSSDKNGKLLTPSLLPSKVLVGEVTNVLEKGGCLRAEDGRCYVFHIENCYLCGVCLHQEEPRKVLVVGMKVEFEVAGSSDLGVVRRVWIGGRDAALAFSSEPTLDSWRSDAGASSTTQQMKEAELLSPNLFPTISKAETTKIIDITA